MRKIVVDVFGADAGVIPVIEGVATAMKQRTDFNAVFVGDSENAASILAARGIEQSRYELVDTDKYITNNDPPTAVFGGNDDSSMVMAYERLKNDSDCVAMLSAGNTGALLVGSICRLGLVQGLKFPALPTAIPSMSGKLVCLVDCGANTECTAADLARFAELGSAFSKSMCGIESPRVGLLSVGREEHNGNALTKAAYPLIKESELNFIGNIEGNDVVTGYADVVVCDGFAGNILLKNIEAVGKAAMALVDEVCTDSEQAVAAKVKQRIFELFDLNSQGGATFLGTKKAVVKMHGSANESTATACIMQILRLLDGGFLAE